LKTSSYRDSIAIQDLQGRKKQTILRKNKPNLTLQSCRMSGMFAVAAASLWPLQAQAGNLLEFLDSIDLNDYTLALNLYGSESHYEGVDDFAIIYPLLKSFSHATNTEEVLYLRDSHLGLRKFTENGWSYGVIGSFQTLGYGYDSSDSLAGMERRTWTIQGGGSVGKRFGPVNIDLFASTDLLGVYKGQQYELKFSYSFVTPKLQIVPQLEFVHQSEDLVDYYYGVTDAEIAPGRPAYAPGAATTPRLSVDVNWRIHPTWYVYAGTSVDFLPDEITNSPIVDKETSWGAHIGIGYAPDSFVEQYGEEWDDSRSEIEVGVGAFFASVTTQVNLDVDVLPASGNLEDEQALDDRKTLVPVEVIWTFGRRHRLDLSYFELSRSNTTDLSNPVTIQGVTFAAGETVTTRFDTRVIRFGYGYSVFRDDQKDLSLFGGIHVTDIDLDVLGANESVSASTTTTLPVLGARFRANFTEKWSVGANAEVFALDFDKYNGHLIDIAISGQYRLGEHFAIYGGYHFYRMNIKSGDESLTGEFSIDYRGPYVSFRAFL
jgi:outer membrane scaffolding protein for murein synthesis (MipA/OmpV family)